MSSDTVLLLVSLALCWMWFLVWLFWVRWWPIHLLLGAAVVTGLIRLRRDRGARW